MAKKVLKTRIQLIRNTTTVLEEKNPQTLYGEFYICTLPDNTSTDKVKFKIGDGRNFNDIPYYEDNLLEVLGIVVEKGSEIDKQILVYNGISGKWENETLADDKSIEFDRENGLSLKGYNSEEANGKIPVKDPLLGIKWITPLNQDQLDAAVAQANSSAAQAGESAIRAGNSAISADTAAQTAQRINEQTMNWVNEKFWWGSVDEYNELPEVKEGAFYLVRL